MAGEWSCIFGEMKNENQILAVKSPSHSCIQLRGERGHGRHFDLLRCDSSCTANHVSHIIPSIAEVEEP